VWLPTRISHPSYHVGREREMEGGRNGCFGGIYVYAHCGWFESPCARTSREDGRTESTVRPPTDRTDGPTRSKQIKSKATLKTHFSGMTTFHFPFFVTAVAGFGNLGSIGIRRASRVIHPSISQPASQPASAPASEPLAFSQEKQPRRYLIRSG
jgi:hypothetical protein